MIKYLCLLSTLFLGRFFVMVKMVPSLLRKMELA